MSKILLLVWSLFWLAPAMELKAQNNDQSTTQKIKKGVKKGAKGVKKGVKKGAHEVAEQASEAKSEVTRTEVENKTGPNGEDIFIDKDSRYYYIDDKGHKVYIAASDLRDKAPKLDHD